MRRQILLVVCGAVLSACNTDRLVKPEALAPNNASRSSDASRIQGKIFASLQLLEAGVMQEYQSDSIRFEAVKQRGIIRIPADRRARMGASMKKVAPSRDRGLNAALPHDIGAGFHLVAASNDPEQDLFNFAEANPVPDQGEDVYLENAPWSTLIGSSYSEDISGTGTIAEVVIGEISTANPNGTINLYVNGVLVATVNPQYTADGAGWLEETSNAQTFSYYGGSTSSGSRTIESGDPKLAEPVSTFPKFHQNLAPFGKLLLTAVLPAQAHALGGCGYYMRGAIIGLAGMAFHARFGNVGGYLLAWVAVVNNVHGYARCKEAQ